MKKQLLFSWSSCDYSINCGLFVSSYNGTLQLKRKLMLSLQGWFLTPFDLIPNLVSATQGYIP